MTFKRNKPFPLKYILVYIIIMDLYSALSMNLFCWWGLMCVATSYNSILRNFSQLATFLNKWDSNLQPQDYQTEAFDQPFTKGLNIIFCNCCSIVLYVILFLFTAIK